MPGNRKRETAVISRITEAEAYASTHAVTDATHDIFRRFFEIQFQPLQQSPRRDVASAEQEAAISRGDDGDNESEWHGITDGEDELQVEVIEYKDAQNTIENLPGKLARKAFMTAKPPFGFNALTNANSKSTKDIGDDEDTAAEAENLKNDIVLQRLLRESHLLDSATGLAPSGKNRHRAYDMRLQSLGAKNSLFEQRKMPMHHRKGIIAKASKKEETRRREAKENGIILEKPALKAKKDPKRRERGIGGPSVGKFAGGTLKLSNSDLKSIRGAPRTLGGKSQARR